MPFDRDDNEYSGDDRPFDIMASVRGFVPDKIGRLSGIRQITGTERAILEFLALADGEGLTLAYDIAAAIGVAPRSMGARLYVLETCGFVKRGLVRRPGRYGRRFHGWVITGAGQDVLR